MRVFVTKSAHTPVVRTSEPQRSYERQTASTGCDVARTACAPCVVHSRLHYAPLLAFVLFFGVCGPLACGRGGCNDASPANDAGTSDASAANNTGNPNGASSHGQRADVDDEAIFPA